ncbi:MAG: YgjP-like metallopeptidase domain-containing protein [Verrucomicrobiota bacterium]
MPRPNQSLGQFPLQSPWRVAERQPLATDEVPIFGEVFRIVSAPELGRKVILNEPARVIRTGRALIRKPAIQRWLRAYAHEFLTARAVELSRLHLLPYNRLFIRAQRTKWGTCSAKRNISLNWRLISTPRLVVDYVILHELVHTKILNHSHGF